MTVVFKGHVEAGFESSHANGPDGHKCAEMHGHSWRAEIEWKFTQDELTEYGWGPDFGIIKDLIRALDHHTLNKVLEFPPSAENIAVHLHYQVHTMFPKVFGLVVRVYEGSGNWIEVHD